MSDIIGKHYLDLDIHQSTFTSFTCKQYNSAEWIYVSVYDNGEHISGLTTLLTSLEVKINTPDNRALNLSTSSTPDLIVISDDVISVHLPQAVFLYDGECKCEIVLTKNTNQLATMTFQIKVIKSVYSEDKVISDAYEVDAVKQLKNFVTEKANIASESAKTATTKANESANSANTASTKATESSNNAKLSKSYAVGGTNSRTNENTDNSKYYKEQASTSATNAAKSETNAKTYANSWKGSLLPQGDVTFSQLPTSGMIKGYMYHITDHFVTNSRFEEGVGYFYPADTCVYWTANNQWKCLSGVLSRELTQAEYDALSTEEKNNGTIYYISDSDNLMKVASSSLDGLMSTSDKKKLDGIETGANKTVIDSFLSSTSTNPVQNKVINSALNSKAGSSHTHNSADINSLDASKLTGTIDIARLPQGALDRLVKVADDTARFALTTDKIQLGDTVKVISTGKMYYVVDETKLSSEDGYEAYTADSATSVPWSGITGKPSSYTPSSHTHDDRYYTESEINTKLDTKVDLSVDGVSKAINQLSTATSVPSDADYYVSQYVSGGTTNTSYHRRPMSALWSYIRTKANSVYSVLGHKHTKSEITDFPTSMAANGGNSSTVNGHIVESDVPANAKFTDTTYSDATTSAHGLMSVADKKILDVIHTPLATCSTGRATVAKVANLQNFVLTTGATVVVKFTDTTGTANPTSGNLTLNVNGTGAKTIVYTRNGNKAALTYANGSSFYNNLTHIFTYDGINNWVCMDWNADNNTTYANMTAATASVAGKAGLVPAPAAGKQSQFLRGDGTWATPTNTTYSAATQSANGLMSSTDKKKLDSITSGANVKFISLTQSQYNALSTIETNVIYFITD